MIRKAMATTLAVLVLASGASAQTPAPLRLRWAPGQVLVYQIEHRTMNSDTRETTTTETKNFVKLTRRWQVEAVDPAGVATVQTSLAAMVQENTLPGGEVLTFDSTNPDKSTPQLRDYLSKLLNIPLARLRIDGQGQVVEVKEAKQGDASRYLNELPFLAVLPAAGPTVGQTWERSYQITLVPPLGTGEKYDAVQKFTCTAITDGMAKVRMTTELKTAPSAPADMQPLWQVMPQGEVVYDVKNGRLHSATLTIDKELKNHAGEGSETHFHSKYTLQYVGDK
jgi:hypothetical protein